MNQRLNGWEAAAKKDAKRYIAGGEKLWQDDEFFASGIKEAGEFTGKFFTKNDFDPQGKRMLDIGCGIGRLARAFSDNFEEVYGTDFSLEIIEKAKIMNKDKPNIHFIKNNGKDLSVFENDFFDFCFSYAVFQHIPDPLIIQNYITEIKRVLTPGGLFTFNVDGRKWGPAKFPIIHRSLYNYLLKIGIIDKVAGLYFSDATKQQAYPGVWLSPNRVERMIRNTGLKVIEVAYKDRRLWCYGSK